MHLNTVHSGLKPFKCFHCSYRSAKKSHIKIHCLKQHEMTEEEFNARAEVEYKSLKKKMGRRPKGEKVYFA